MIIFAFFSLFSAVFTFTVGSFVYMKSSKGSLTTSFFFFALIVSILSFIQFQMRIAEDYNHAYLWSKLYAIWPLSLALAIHFVLELERRKRRSIFIYLIIYLPGIIISYIQFSTNQIALPPVEKYWGWSMQYVSGGPIQTAILTYLIFYWFVTILLLFYFYKNFSGKAKTQVLFICVGFLLNFFVSFLSDVIIPMQDINIPELGSAMDAFTFSIIAFGIWRYDLFRLKDDALSNKLFSSISNYLILVDSNRKILEINNRFLNRLNYSADELYGQNLDIILAEKSQKINPLSKYIDEKSIFENKVILFRTKDGFEVPLSFSASHIKLDMYIKPGHIYVGAEDNLHYKTQLLLNNSNKQTNFLAEVALDLMKINNTEEIYEYLADQLYTLLHKKALIVCAENHVETDYMKWEIKGIRGVHPSVEGFCRGVGIHLHQLKGTTKTKYIENLEEGKLSELKLQIEKLTGGIIPKSVGEKLIRLSGVKQLYSIPFLHQQKVSGVISILCSKSTPKIDIKLVESFAAIASAVLKRKYFENDLAELNLMQNKLFSVIGHDLKSPISNILSYTDMIINDYNSFTNDSLYEFFQSIQRSANSGFDILNSLLLWSKSVQGGVPVKTEYLDLNKKIVKAIDQVNPIANKKDIQIVNNIKRRLHISADRNMLITIIRNLLSNAIKFTQSGGQIIINAIEEKNTISISIADNGIGMSASQVNNLFKLDSITVERGTAGEKGSGFGLLICKDFIEKNNGTITVKSELKKGSVFTINFLLEPVKEHEKFKH